MNRIAANVSQTSCQNPAIQRFSCCRLYLAGEQICIKPWLQAICHRSSTLVEESASEFRDHSFELATLHHLASMATGPFYSPLDPTKHEIHLLRVHLAASDHFYHIIKCDLFHASLDDPDLEYDALSYCWGNRKPPQKIITNDTEVLIRPSLDWALRHLRRPEQALVLWADAVCINQSDVEEKNHQVQQMGLVYSRSLTARGWLGTGRFGAELSSDLLTWWAESTKPYRFNGHPFAFREFMTFLEKTPDSFHRRQSRRSLTLSAARTGIVHGYFKSLPSPNVQ